MPRFSFVGLLFSCTLPVLAAAQPARKPAPPSQMSSQEIAASARGSVVVIQCLDAGGKLSLGSGFFVDAIGLIATNAHVIADCAEPLVREASKDVPSVGRPLLIDSEDDVAIIAVAKPGSRPLPFAPSSETKQGDRVYAIGHPEGLEFTISDGIVSAFRELRSRRFVQTTAPISPGSSGGPLLDSRGRVVGMTTLFLSEGQNLNFAVPADAIQDALARARRHAKGGGSTPAMSPATAVRIAHTLREQENFEAAGKILSAALKEEPSRLDLLLETGLLALAQKRLTDAERIARQMLGVEPNFAPAHQMLGFVLASAGNWDEGCREERRCLELNPDAEYRALANNALAICEERLWKGRPNDPHEAATARALSYIEAAIEWDGYKENSHVHVRHAGLLQMSGQIARANSAAKYALALPSITPEERAILKTQGLPREEIRIVSLAQSQRDKFLGLFVVTGIVVNEGSEPASFVRIIAECKDARGRLVGTGSGYVEPNTLPPGESGSFEILLKGPLDAICDLNARIATSD